MLRNLIHRLQYRICDLWLDFKMAIVHLKQWNCKHKYKFVRRIQYDAETGYSMVQRVCTKCRKIDFKTNRVAKNYGRINKNLPRWHHNI